MTTHTAPEPVSPDASGKRNDAALICQDISITYPNGFTAVSEVSLELGPGEIIAILGASGSGKSTLLRGIAGLERITAGTVEVHGRVMDGPGVTTLPVHLRDVGVVFQDGQLFPHRTVGGNIEFGLKLAGVDQAARKQRVAEMLELIELEGYADRSVTSLSGGQAQRVALARSLAPNPSVLLLDEPLSALDRGLRERLATEMRTMLRETHTPALHVTHDFAEAFTVADRILVIDRGKIVAIGTPQELLSGTHHPAVDSVLGADQRVTATITSVTDTGADVNLGATTAHIRDLRGKPGDTVLLRLS